MMRLEPTIELTDAPGEADAEFLLRGLIADNRPYLGELDHRRLWPHGPCARASRSAA